MKPEVQAALAWVNGIREANKLEPLSDLRKGIPLAANRCILARSLSELNACVVPGSIVRQGYYELDGMGELELPSAPDIVARMFDDYLLPEYVAPW